MTTTIHEAIVADKPILRNLMQLYRHDFSIYDGSDVDTHGLYDYKYLDLYWIEATRYPYLVRVEGQIAGLVLLRQGCYNFKTSDEDADLLSIAEFFVLRKYRRSGVGQFAAQWAFAQFAGRWQVSTPDNNIPAQAFWDKVIADVSAGAYERFEADNDVVFQFINSKS